MLKKVLFLFIVFSSLYMLLSGVFQPKVIYLDNIKIQAPNDSVLVYVTTEGNDISTLSLPFIFRTNYTFPTKDFTQFVFKGNKTILDITLNKDIENEEYFKKVFSKLLEKKDFNMIDEKKCLIYKYKDDFYNIRLFHRVKFMQINITSNINSIDKYISLFCM